MSVLGLPDKSQNPQTIAEHCKVLTGGWTAACGGWTDPASVSTTAIAPQTAPTPQPAAPSPAPVQYVPEQFSTTRLLLQ